MCRWQCQTSAANTLAVMQFYSAYLDEYNYYTRTTRFGLDEGELDFMSKSIGLFFFSHCRIDLCHLV